MKAQEIALRAAELVSGDRHKTHGEAKTNLTNIARLWSAWLDKEVTGKDVAVMMGLLKYGRMKSGTTNIDDAVDACGYSALTGIWDDQ